jgi:hypothetical protein
MKMAVFFVAAPYIWHKGLLNTQMVEEVSTSETSAQQQRRKQPSLFSLYSSPCAKSLQQKYKEMRCPGILLTKLVKME